MIYLDTSALAKLVVAEPESPALSSWLSERQGDPLVTSALTRVELHRLALRAGLPAMPGRVDRVLDLLGTVPISDAVVERAQTLGPASIRSLDAIHLATIDVLSPGVEAVVGYDHRLLDAVAAEGTLVVSPGA